MKNRKINIIRNIMLFLGVLFFSVSCERELVDDNTPASFSKTGEIFTDDFVGLGGNFYFPYGDSKFTAFSVDRTFGYQSNASIRLDVPNANDAEGAYAGGIFRIDGAGRNLSDYDALTFWAKASQGVTVGEFGFGEDFIDNKYLATIKDVSIGTGWTKYIIPIPDASKLLQERGMFRYAAGTVGTNGLGYTIWIDELRFEKLGTIGQVRPFIYEELDVNGVAFVGQNLSITGVGVKSNLGNGQDIKVFTSSNYFSFNSSDSNVAVANLDEVSFISAGTATITAKLGAVNASGSLTVSSIGLAPTPTLNAANVISVFSDAYTNVPVDYFNGYWQYSTALGQDDININGNKIIKYSQLNFVGTEFQGPKTINASAMTHFHIDIYVEDQLQSGDFIRILLQDLGTDNVFGGGNDRSGSFTINSTSNPALVNGGWISVDVPLSSFPGLSTKSNLAQIVYVTEGTNPNAVGNIKSIYIDNIYFHN